ncbi:MAG: hypothetical protein ABSF89_10845 [Acidimicrobiales bacterium]|jgi:hypothetical protein
MQLPGRRSPLTAAPANVGRQPLVPFEHRGTRGLVAGWSAGTARLPTSRSGLIAQGPAGNHVAYDHSRLEPTKVG